jgi:serine/threonine protein kinase
MFRQLLNGLLHLQELGIGHRDMSLENMLFDGVDRFVIIDFGMCLRLKKDPTTGKFHDLLDRGFCGKRNYIAPEVMRKDAQFNPMLCDIWAAGVILFIALTGLPPVDTATLNDERFRMICDGRLQEMLNSWGMKVDSQAVDLMQKILRPQPQVSNVIFFLLFVICVPVFFTGAHPFSCVFSFAQFLSACSSIIVFSYTVLTRVPICHPHLLPLFQQDRLTIQEILQHPWLCHAQPGPAL